MHWRTGVILVLAGLLVAAAWQPASGKPVQQTPQCADSISAGPVFIGHDCGDIADIVIAGRVVIQNLQPGASAPSQPVTKTPTPAAAKSTKTPKAKGSKTPTSKSTPTPTPTPKSKKGKGH
jgi:cytoskeletal protein RodZ